jgi:TIGR03009 family protein
MAGRRTVVISPLVAILAMGFALAAAQDGGVGAPKTPRRQQPPAQKAQAAQQFPPEAMDALLAGWEGQSAKLQTLEVDIYRIDKDPDWGDEAHFEGHAAFKSPDLAYVDYRKVKMQSKPDPNVKGKTIVTPVTKNGRPESKPFETILCTGAEVWHYRWDVTQIIVWDLDKDARRRALDEGPLPFLFHMKARDAKQRYAMFLSAQNDKYSVVEVKPLFKDDADVFSTAWVKLDRAYVFPMRIVLISPDGSKQQDFRLSNIKANNPVKKEYFVGVKPGGKNWKLERNPVPKEAGVPDQKRARRLGEPKSARSPASAGNATQN